MIITCKFFADQQSSQGSNVVFSENEEMLITMVYNLVGERLVSLKFVQESTSKTKIPVIFESM